MKWLKQDEKQLWAIAAALGFDTKKYMNEKQIRQGEDRIIFILSGSSPFSVGTRPFLEINDFRVVKGNIYNIKGNYVTLDELNKKYYEIMSKKFGEEYKKEYEIANLKRKELEQKRKALQSELEKTEDELAMY